MGRRIRERKQPPQTLPGLTQALMKELEVKPQLCFRMLIRRMARGV